MKRNWRLLGHALTVLAAIAILPSAGLAATVGTSTDTGTLNWSALTWTGGTPNGAGDVAKFNPGTTTASLISLNQTVTLGRLEYGLGSDNNNNFVLSGPNTLTFDSGLAGTPASLLMTRMNNTALQREISASIQLNSDLVATWGRVQVRVEGLTGVIAGSGQLAIYYATNPPAGNTDASVSVNLNGARQVLRLGAAGGAANTHSGGTLLKGASGDFTNLQFRAYKQNAFGSGPLIFPGPAGVNLDVFNQTVGGLSGGTIDSRISSLSGTAGTTTLTLDFPSTAAPFTFAGRILDGSAVSGYTAPGTNQLSGSLTTDTAVRKLALAKAGSGTQTLTGANGYSGGTSITGGVLVADNDLALGSGPVSIAGGTLSVSSLSRVANPVTLSSGRLDVAGVFSGTLAATGGTVGGTGTIEQTFSVGSGVTVAPGSSVGTLTAGPVAFQPGGTFEFEINDAAGQIGMSQDWDWLFAGVLDVSGISQASPFTVDVVSLLNDAPGDAANFDPTLPYEWRFVSYEALTGAFDPAAFVIDPSAFSNDVQGGTFGISQVQNGLAITFEPAQVDDGDAAVPEPVTLAMLGLASAGLGGYVRRR